MNVIPYIKKYTILFILFLLIPAILIFFIDIIYFILINYSDNQYIESNGNEFFSKKVTFSDGNTMYSVLHIKLCIISLFVSLISLRLVFNNKIYIFIYAVIMGLSYLFANIFNYYNIIINPIIEFYFSLFISFILSSSTYFLLTTKR